MTQQVIASFSKEFATPQKTVEEMIEFIGENVKPKDKVLIALSGGVDSSTVTSLASRAIPNAIYPIFIDTGYMRIMNGRKEADVIAEVFKDVPNLIVLDESETFYNKTFGIKDGNEKRKAFRSTYDSVLNREAKRLGCNIHMDGTIRPDIVETKKGLKEQSNVGNVLLFEKKIEPLAPLYKHQVRKCAEAVGLPEEIAYRQPFPGPGLSLRTVEEIGREKLEVERKANDIVERGVERFFKETYGKPFLYDELTGERIPFQYFAVTLDNSLQSKNKDEREIERYVKSLTKKDTMAVTLENKSTGVAYKGEEMERIYTPVLALHIDGEVSSLILTHLGKVIPQKFGYSRVIHEIQNGNGKFFVSIQNIKSLNAVTSESIVNLPAYRNIAGEIREKCSGVGAVFQDISSKPPATIEYE